MKKLFLVFCALCIAIGLHAAVSKTVNLTTAGTLSTVLTATELTTITDLTLTGTIDQRDFVTMRSAMTVLANIDMSAVTVVAYGAYGLNVIPDYAFAGCTRLTSITIPNLVTATGNGTFSNCSSLITISLPSSVTSIQSYAFQACSGLTSISLPSSVTSIANSAFENCSGLTSIKMLSSTPLVLQSNNVFYNVPKTIPLYVPAGSKAAYAAAAVWNEFTNIIEDDPSVVTIKNTAGGLATALSGQLSTIKTLVVTGTIDARDFKTMRDLMPLLENVDLSGATVVAYTGTAGTESTSSTVYAVNEVPNDAFFNHTTYVAKSSLKSIKLPNSATAIGAYAFLGCSGLTSITIPNSVTTIGNYAFNYCSGLTSITIPNSVTTIGDSAFSYCSGLTSITIPNSVTTIGNYAFDMCRGLTSIRVLNPTPIFLPSSGVFVSVSKTIPLYVPVGSKAAYTAAAVWKDFTNIIEIDNSTIVSSAGNLASILAGNLTATSIKLVGTIDARDFKTMRDLIPNLTTVDLSGATIVAYTGTEGTGGATSQTYSANIVPVSAFESNKTITSVSLPSAATTIGGSAFRFCFALSTITLPTSLTTISSRAFESCSLTSFSMPSSVTSIGSYAFMGSSVTSFTVNSANANYTAINGVVCNKAATAIVAFPSGRVGVYSIPNSITTISDYGFAYSKKLTAIIIPSSIVSFAGGTFSGCSGITSIRVFNTTPITAATNDFGSVTKTIPLYVPAGTKALYAAATGWKDFTNIVEVPESVVCTAGKLSTLLSTVLDQIYTIKITGTIDARDFKTMRDLMPNLASVDLSGATIVAYTGTEGTVSTASRTYPANTLPAYAFFDGTNGKSTLTSIVLPTSINILGSAAFKNCGNLTTAAIPSGITSIENSIFYNASITTANIPASVTALGSYLFPSSVATVTVAWPQPLDVSTNLSVFSNYGILNVPAGTKKLYQAAAVWKSFTIVSPFETSVSSVSMTSAGGTATVGVTSTLTWTATSSAAWLTVSPGSANLTLTAGATTAARTATITFTAAGMSPQTVTVTQEAGTSTLSVASTAVSLDKGASSATVGVTSNTTWTASAGTATWLTLSQTTTALTIAATANTSATARTATVTVSAAGVSSKTITVTQAGNPSITLISTTAALGKANGNTTTFTITCNTAWAISTPDAWVSASAVSGTGDAAITLTAVGDNPLATTRNSILLITATGLAGAKGLTVTQAANPTVSAAATASVAKTANSTATVVVTSNTAWTATSSATWLAATGASTGNGTLTLTATETNPTTATRTATITLAATGATSQTITVTQAAGDATLSVAATTASVTKAAKSTATVAVTSNTAWTATTAATWLTATGASTGNGTITITTTEANPTITARTATISVAATGATSQTITVTQAAGDPTLSVAAATASVAKAAKSTATVAVTSNTTWTATTAATWFTATGATKGSGTLTITTTEANPAIIARTATITVAATGATSQTITVTQAAGDATLSVAATTASVNKAAKSTATVAVTSNTAWTATTAATWLTATGATTGNGTLTITTTEANPTIAARTATITVAATGATSQTITVTQAAGDATLSVAATTASVTKATKSSATVAVTSNTTWTATTAATWLTATGATTSNGTLTITSTEANPTIAARTATITVAATGATSQTITVTQAAGDATLSVAVTTASVTKAAKSTATVAVTSNTAWTATTAATWLTATGATTGNGTLTITTTEANPTIAARTATISVAATGATSQTITVTQAAGDATLSVNASAVTVGKASGSKATVLVTSNSTWTVGTPSETWLTAAAASNTTLIITASSANPLLIERTATVTITETSGLKQLITVTQTGGDATLSVDQASVSLYQAPGSSEIIKVSSNTDWTAASDASWLILDPVSTTGDGSFTITSPEANPMVTQRTATVTVSAKGATTQNIIVTQEAGIPTLSVAATSALVTKKANSTASIAVTSNTAWTATSSENWLTTSGATTGSGTLTITTTEANPTIATRWAIINVEAKGATSKTIVVTQAVGDPMLLVASTDVSLDKTASSTATLAVTSNDSWMVTTGSAWLEFTPDYPTTGNGIVTFRSIDDNPTTSERRAMVVINADHANGQVIYVTQAAGDATLRVLETAFLTGNTVDVKREISVTSNVNWQAATSASWLSVSTAKTEDGGRITITTTQANPTITTREATVSVSAAEVANPISIIVTQEAGEPTLAASSEYTKFRAAQDTLKVDVTSNAAWEVAADANWIHFGVEGDSANASFLVVADSNKLVEPRTANMVILAKDANPVNITFTQVGDTILVVKDTLVSFAAAVNLDKRVDVVSNTSWKAQSQAEWVSTSMINDTLHLIAQANTSIKPRTTTLIVSTKGAKDGVVKLVQVGDTILTVSTLPISFKALADSSVLAINSNTKWTVSSSEPWLTIKAGIDSGDAELNVVAAENKTTSQRTATLTISAKGVTAKTIAVTQAAGAAFFTAPATAHVSAKVDTATTVKINANISWTAVAAQEWLNVSPATGSESSELIIAASPNTDLAPRTGTVYLSAGKIKKTIVVTQGGDTVLSVSANAHTFAAKADTLKLAVTANIAWEATASAEWVSVNPAKQTGDGQVVVSALANTSIKPRTAMVKVANGAIIREIAITQVGDTTMTVSNAAILFAATADSVSLPVTANTKWTASSSQTWLSTVAVVDSGSADLRIVAKRNVAKVERAGDITVSAKGVEPIVIHVIQAASPSFVEAPASVRVAATKDTVVAVAVQSNIAWTAMAVDEWLSLDIANATGDATLSITAESNKSLSPRKGSVLLSAGSIRKTISVEQGGDTVLTVNATAHSFAAKADTLKLAVTANSWWQATTSADWLLASPAKQTGNAELVISALANTSIKPRTAIVRLENNAIVREIAITQVGDTILSCNTTAISLRAKQDTATVALTANTAWKAVCSESWLSIVSTLDSGSTNLQIIASHNKVQAERTAKITISAKGASPKEIVVTQAASPAFVSVPALVNLAASVDTIASVEVSANVAWTAMAVDKWLTIDPTSATGDATMTISAESNKGFASRKGSILLSSGKIKQTIVVNQYGTAELSVSNTSISAEKTGIEAQVTVKANVAWTVASSDEWVSVVATGQSGDGSLAISVAANTTSIARTATVTLSSSDAAPQTIRIEQAAGDAAIEVSTTTVTFNQASANPVSVLVNANKDWTATSDAEWLHLSLSNVDLTSASSTVSFTTTSATSTALWFVASNNTTTNDRVATVTITIAGAEPQVITVIQAAAPVVVVSELSLSETSLAITSSANVDVTANKDWTATSDADWLQVSLSGVDFASASSSVSFATATSTTAALWFVAASNTTTVERTAKVTVTVAGIDPQVVTVTQAAAPVVVTPELIVSMSSVNFTNATTTVIPVEVRSNVAWTASSNEEWLHVSLSGGEFNAETFMMTYETTSTRVSFNAASSTTSLWFIAATNTTSTNRSAIVTIIGEGCKPQTVFVNQPAAPVVATPELTVSTSAVTFTAATSTAYTTVTANKDWTATSDADWLQVSLSGVDFASASSSVSFATATSTSTALWFVAASNTTTVERTAKVTINVAGAEPKVISITQLAASLSSLTVSRTAVDFTAKVNDSKEEVKIQSTNKWQIESTATWLHIDVNEAQNVIVMWTTEANPTVAVRTAYVNVSAAGAASQVITVTQAAGIAKVSVSVSDVKPSAAAGTTVVTVTANTPWTTRTTADWLTVSSTATALSIATSENKTILPRNASVEILVNGVVVQTINVSQSAGEASVSAAATASVEATANSSVRIAVSANTKWSAVSSESWVTITQSTSSGDGEIIVSVLANPSNVARKAVILLTGTGATAQTITITQAAGTTDASETLVSSIAVYPNPTTEYFMLNTNARVTVYNQAGTCMFAKQVVAGEAIALDALSVGTYKVVIETPSSRTTQQLIKQ